MGRRSRCSLLCADHPEPVTELRSMHLVRWLDENSPGEPDCWAVVRSRLYGLHRVIGTGDEILSNLELAVLVGCLVLGRRRHTPPISQA